jgi:hypothetical protein
MDVDGDPSTDLLIDCPDTTTHYMTMITRGACSPPTCVSHDIPPTRLACPTSIGFAR